MQETANINRAGVAAKLSAQDSHCLVLHQEGGCVLCSKRGYTAYFAEILRPITLKHNHSSSLFYKQITCLVLCRSPGRIRSRFLDICCHNSSKEYLRKQFSSSESKTAISVLANYHRILPRICIKPLYSLMRIWRISSATSKLPANFAGNTVD